MIDLFKSDFAPVEKFINFDRQHEETKVKNVESFANADFERQYNDSRIIKVVEKDPYSDIRIRGTQESKVVNDLNPEQKHYDDNNDDNNDDEEIIDDSNEIEYTMEDFGKDVVCNCGVNVIKANNIISEVSKKAVNLDSIVSKLDKKQMECVLKKINKYKLKQFPKEAVDVVKKNDVNVEEEIKKSNEEKVSNKIKLKKEMKKKENVQVEEEEEDYDYNIFKDIFSNEIILLVVIIILAFTYLK